MTKIKIMTDSTVQLSKEEQEKYGITVIPLSAMIQNTLYYDNQTISKAEFLQKMNESPTLPKTSQPAVGQYIELYNQLGADGSEILSIHVASYLSGTYAAAVQASKLTKTKVTVVDSGTVDRAMAYQVLTAAEMSQNHASMEEILVEIRAVKEKVELYVGIVDLENLIKGGRIGKVLGRVSTMLNMKIMLKVTDTALEPEAKGRGLKSLKKKTQLIIEEMKQYEMIEQIGITHVGLTDFAEEVIAELKKQFPNADYHIAYASPTLMTHAGKGAFAISYMAK
ncbi:DegV family protein [Desemzia sp. RIT804]|uniref:DegV family protein n=1 Tax=Desemzia sp. RIT 804 TaxID=2810209 RepID=UPI0019520F05|nr:DegV family protein [Desemzia sp. RIT 804]MBM6613898.1 DegV family protein [Desemzia sp. RIT 804]